VSRNDIFITDDKKYFESELTKVHTVDAVEHLIVKHVDLSLDSALKQKSKLTEEMTVKSITGEGMEIEDRLLGFSGWSFRHLMNNLCNYPGANYLEIGVYRGSTLISAIYGNEDILGEVHAIENYSEFTNVEDPRICYERALEKYIPNTRDKIQFHELDCFSMDLNKLPKIDIYFYDGEHSLDAQYRAFKYFEPVFADTFIAVVDDWEQKKVREGTKKAFSEIGYDVVSSRSVIPAKRPDNKNRVNNPTLDWWNGTFVAVLKKRKE